MSIGTVAWRSTLAERRRCGHSMTFPNPHHPFRLPSGMRPSVVAVPSTSRSGRFNEWAFGLFRMLQESKLQRVQHRNLLKSRILTTFEGGRAVGWSWHEDWRSPLEGNPPPGEAFRVYSLGILGAESGLRWAEFETTVPGRRWHQNLATGSERFC